MAGDPLRQFPSAGDNADRAAGGCVCGEQRRIHRILVPRPRRIRPYLLANLTSTSPGTVALSLPPESQSRIARMLRWSDGDCEVVEGDAEPVVSVDVGGDVVVAAAQVLHEGVTGGHDPC